jgi:hypothetical protein
MRDGNAGRDNRIVGNERSIPSLSICTFPERRRPREKSSSQMSERSLQAQGLAVFRNFLLKGAWMSWRPD